MKHYLTYSEPKPVGNGMVRQVFSTVPVRYLDGDRYRDIDLQLKSVGKNSFENTSIPHKCLFPKKASGAIIYQNQGHEVSFKALCSPVDGYLNKHNSVYYPDAFGDGCSLELIAGPFYLRKNVVIEKRPVSIPDYLEFKFEVNGSGIPLPAYNVFFDHELTLDDGEDNTSYLRRSITVDGRGTTYRLPLCFRKEGGKLYLVKRIPRAVLERCVYPLRFDATITPTSHTGDGYAYGRSTVWATARGLSTGTGFDTASDFLLVNCGKSGSYYYIYRAGICFDTSALPDTLVSSMISLARLWLYVLAYEGPIAKLCVVRSFQASATTFAAADYNDIGSDATETAGRATYTPTIQYADAAYSVASTGWKAVTLNSNFTSRVSLTGYTQIGIRPLYDVVDHELTSWTEINIVSANYAGFEPTLEIIYDAIALLSNYDGGIGASGCGYFVAGGSEYQAIMVADVSATMEGGAGIGGSCLEERTVTWAAQTAPFVIGSDIKNILSVTATSSASGYAASDLIYYHRPGLYWKSTSSLAQTITIQFDGGIDTLALIDCNFAYYSITVVGATSGTFANVSDGDKDAYSSLALINTTGNAGKETSKLIINIPAQTPYFSETAFRIGSVIGFKRSSLASYPVFPCSRKVIENVKERDFDGGTNEVEKVGRHYALYLFSFPRIGQTAFDELQNIERACGASGYIVFSEYYSDYSCRRLCQKEENFRFDYVARQQYSTQMLLREIT